MHEQPSHQQKTQCPLQGTIQPAVPTKHGQRLSVPLSGVSVSPLTSTFPVLAWCYLATPSCSKKRGDTAPSLHSSMPTDISIIDLRETPALLGVCRGYRNCNGILMFSQDRGKSPFAKCHGLLCAWYSHRCPLNMQLLGPHLSLNNPSSSFLNLPKPPRD